MIFENILYLSNTPDAPTIWYSSPIKADLTCELELGVVELGRPAVLAPLLFAAPLELSPSPLGSPPKSECIEREGEVDIGAGG